MNDFIAMVETQFDKKVKITRSCNGPEFISSLYYAQRAIFHQISCVFQSRKLKKYWSYLVLHVVFLMKRIPTKVLHKKSSYEVLYGSVPDLIHLKVFGRLSYDSTLPKNRHKFYPRARKCVFLGYKSRMK